MRVFSSNLARRGDLERDVEAALRERCDVFLTELKAAAIDVVAEAAARAGAQVDLPAQPSRRGARASRRSTKRWLELVELGRTRAAAGGRGGALVSSGSGARRDPPTVVVRSDYGLPYSKGLMAQSLMATGLSSERSFALAQQIEERLVERKSAEIGVDELRAWPRTWSPPARASRCSRASGSGGRCATSSGRCWCCSVG